MPIQGLVGYGGGATSLNTGTAPLWGDYSVFFDGDDDFLTFADNSSYAAGTGDLCVEFWCKLSSTGTYQNVVATRDSSGTTAGWTFSRESDGTIGFYSTNQQYTPAGNIATGTWTHVVAQRESSKLRAFQDGVLIGYNGNQSQNFTNQLFTIGINCDNGGVGWVEGYLSNVRYVTGSVPTTYSTTETTLGETCFTVPSTPLTLTSQGCTSSDVAFLGCNYRNVSLYTHAASSMTVTGCTGGHDGPF